MGNEVEGSHSFALQELLDQLASTEFLLAASQTKVQHLEAHGQLQSAMIREGYDLVLEERLVLEARVKDLQEHLDQEAENFDVLAAVHEETLDLLGQLREDKANFQRQLSDAHRERVAAAGKLEEVSREPAEELIQLRQALAAVSAERDAAVSQVKSLEAECESACWLRQQLSETEDLLCESEEREAEQGRKYEQAFQQCSELEHQLADSCSRQRTLQQQLGELQAKDKCQPQFEGYDVEERTRAVSSIVAELEERTKAAQGGVSLVAESPMTKAAFEPDPMTARSEVSSLASPENALEERFQDILSQQETEAAENLFSSALDELVDERDMAMHGLNQARQEIVRLELEVEALKLSTSCQHERIHAAVKQEMQAQMQQEAAKWMATVQGQAKAALAQRDEMILELQKKLQVHVMPKDGVEFHTSVLCGLPTLSGKAEPAAAG